MTKDPDKELYSFSVTSVKEVEETTVHKDEATGEETKITKKVKKETPTRFFIKRPSRRQQDEAGLEYAVKLSEYVKKGVLTKAMMTKKYADTGGVLTEQEGLYLTSRYKRLADIQREFVSLSLKVDSLDEVGRVKLAETTEEINTIRKEIASLESQYSFIFQHSADMKADAHCILWYSLMLTYVDEEVDGKQVLTPYFKGDTFEEKLDSFYKLEESGETFYYSVRQKLAYFISWWYNGAIATKEEFSNLEKEIDSGAA